MHVQRMRHLLERPEYVCRPSQVARRLLLAARRPRGRVQARLAWGDPIVVDADQMIGHTILRRGAFDLPVAEALWRLTDPGDHALDIGAHIGVMTSLLARRSGARGRVDAFEPQPATYDLLRENVRLWDSGAAIHLHQVAASDESGVAALYIPDESQRNDSLSTLIPRSGFRPVTTERKRLDDVLFDVSPTVAKLDVEGAELAVLNGARRVLASIRDLVFEHREYPTAVTTHLESQGFTILRLEIASVWRLALVDPGSVRRRRQEGDNMLATRAVARAGERFTQGGWHCLHGKISRRGCA